MVRTVRVAPREGWKTAVLTAALLFGIAFALGLQGAGAQAQNQDMMRLQDQLRDCRADDCVPIRDQMMSQLRDRLQNCTGVQCNQLQDRLRLHEQVQACHMSERGCRELRMQEREQVRPRYHYGDGRGMGYGMGSGMGRGMGGQGRGMGN